MLLLLLLLGKNGGGQYVAKYVEPVDGEHVKH